MTAAGHRWTVWTRASAALYGGAPRGRVWPSLGRFLTRISVAAGEVAFYDLGGVEAETSREAVSDVRRGRGANCDWKGDDRGDCHMMMSMDLRRRDGKDERRRTAF